MIHLYPLLISYVCIFVYFKYINIYIYIYQNKVNTKSALKMSGAQPLLIEREITIHIYIYMYIMHKNSKWNKRRPQKLNSQHAFGWSQHRNSEELFENRGGITRTARRIQIVSFGHLASTIRRGNSFTMKSCSYKAASSLPREADLQIVSVVDDALVSDYINPSIWTAPSSSLIVEHTKEIMLDPD